MLSALLPGLRQVRAPLIVGYLWLVTGWLAFRPAAPDSQSGSDLESTAAGLIEWAGPSVVLATATVIAYFVGSMLLVRHLPAWLPFRHAYDYQWAHAAHSVPPPPVGHTFAALLGHPIGFMAGYLDEVQDTRSRWERMRRKTRDSSWENELLDQSVLVAALAKSLALEDRRGEHGIALQVASESVYNDYDRERQEALLRYNLIPPMVVLSAVLTVEVAYWVGPVGLLLVSLLYRDAARAHVAATQVAFNALTSGMIQSRAVEGLLHAFGCLTENHEPGEPRGDTESGRPQQS